MSLRYAVVVAGLALGLMSEAAKAVPLSFTINAGAVFSFTLDSKAKPEFVSTNYNQYSNVEVTISAPNFPAQAFNDYVGFVDSDNGGGLFIYDGSSIAFEDSGPQIFGGTLDHPSFAPAVIQLDGGPILTIALSTVPLPASAPMFGAALLSLAGIGYAAKRKRAGAAA